jgi:hypothetical protein
MGGSGGASSVAVTRPLRDLLVAGAKFLAGRQFPHVRGFSEITATPGFTLAWRAVRIDIIVTELDRGLRRQALIFRG